MSVDKKIELLKNYDDAYFSGDPSVSDAEYDALKESIRKEIPTNEYFNEVGSVPATNKVKLPHTLGSLNELKRDDDITRWVKSLGSSVKSFIVTPKLDGVSCMAHYKNSNFTTAYSRGNGIEGQNITRHLEHVVNIPKNITPTEDFYLRGELIVKESTFNEQYNEQYARALNLVSGNVNSKTTNSDIMSSVNFIAYEIVRDSYDNTKSDTLELLSNHGFSTVPHTVLSASELNVNKLSAIFKQYRDEMDFALDGIVVTVNEYNEIGELFKEDNINPRHSFKYKELDESAVFEARVKDVHWNVSKHGALKPRVEIEPVVIYSTVVSYATGFNAKFINDNGIGPGAKIKITKSGTVIPYILEILEPSTPKMPSVNWTWNETEVDAISDDGGDDVTIKKLSHFFTTLDVEQLRETSIIKVFDFYKMGGKSFDDTVAIMFDMIEKEWTNILGENGRKIYNSLHQRLSHLNVATLIGSLPYFGIGFGVRRAKKLLKQYDFSEFETLTLEDINIVEGFNDKTATKFLNGMPELLNFLNTHDDVIEFKEAVQTDTVLDGIVVVMSGFRDKELSENIEMNGGRVVSGVSNKITHLIVVDVNSNTSKIKKARALEKEIINVNDFKRLYNL